MKLHTRVRLFYRLLLHKNVIQRKELFKENVKNFTYISINYLIDITINYTHNLITLCLKSLSNIQLFFFRDIFYTIYLIT